ncbi:J domain-containing protein [Pseudonocardia sp. ICBG601]|uniref:J domain-containing protein n=1 Tax=Pseudonocardia sp. ICBG601 TaxID=2846759 RepID=UPI001CF63586|nr:J domain-containing protein [Pseudonocardia sp. ICBG601]
MNTPTPTGQDRAQAAALLGVPPTATPEALRAAWRTAVRHAHPDRGGDTERFIAVNAAYELLTTPPAPPPARPTPPTPTPPPPGPQGTATPSSDLPGSPVDGLLILRVAALLVAAGVLTAGVAMIAAPVAAAMVALVATAAVAHHVYLATETHRPG